MRVERNGEKEMIKMAKVSSLRRIDGKVLGGVNDVCHKPFSDIVNDHGHHVIGAARVVLICWGRYYQSHPDAVSNAQALVSDLVAGPFVNGLAQYGIDRGSLTATFVIDDPAPPATLDENAARDKIKGWILSGAVQPAPRVNEGQFLYLLFPPPATTLTLSDGTTGFCGYHQHAKYNGPSVRDDLFWAIVSTSGADQSSGGAFVRSVSYCVSHEVAETLTNRDGGGYFSNANGCEIGDLCEQNPTFTYRGWQVEQYWSNNGRHCVNGDQADTDKPLATSAAVSWGPGRLDVFGLGTDNQIFHKFFERGWGPSPTGWQPLGGIFNSPPAAVSWSSGRLDIFALGMDNDMFHKAFDGSWRPSPSDWEPLGGVFNCPPVVVSWGPGRLDIFALGMDNDMFHKAFDGAWRPSPTDWEPLGGAFTSAPAVVAWAAGRLDIFGVGEDRQMYHKFWEGDWGPSGWEPLGGAFNSAPAAASWGPGHLDIFCLGTDNQMYHKYFDGGWGPSPTGWEALGGVFRSMPAVVSWGSGRLDIFGVGIDNQMYHKYFDGGWGPSLSGWESLGGHFNSAPAAVSWSPGRLDIFGLGADNQMYHKYFDGGWGPSPTGWEPLGGVFNKL
jgi:hypothetical protein